MTIDILKTELWKKVIGNATIAKRNHYYEEIQGAILKETGYTLSRDTIRNFIEGRNNPSPRTLDIYATFIIGGTQEEPKTFQDFQEWWEETYAEDREAIPLHPFLINRGLIVAFVLLLIIVIVGSLLGGRVSKGDNSDFYYEFRNSDLSVLERDGWFLFSDVIDRSEFDNVKDLPGLRLRTFLGGGHLENDDYEPYQKNFLAYPIECHNCEIEVSITDFNPTERYQQAGLFLFYNESPVPSLRCTYVSAGDDEHNIYQAILRTGKYDNTYLCPWSRYGDRIGVTKVQNGVPNIIIDSIVFQLRIKNGETYFFRYKIDEGDYVPVRSMSLDLPTPKYLAMAAFQGRPDVPYPVYPVADSIYARFNYVRVRPLEDSD